MHIKSLRGGNKLTSAKPKSSSDVGGHIRIIGGLWRGRKLPVPNLPGLRPTADRVKETVFNWLQFEIRDLRVLDAFAGTGSLGLEALSRGAREVVFIENSSHAAQQLRSNLDRLGAQKVAHIFQQDALLYLENTEEAFELILLDPPFEQGYVQEAIARIHQYGIVKDNGWIYIESESSLSLDAPINWRLHREKKMGQVRCRLYQITR